MAIDQKQLEAMTLEAIFEKYPFAEEFLSDSGLPVSGRQQLTLPELLSETDPELLADRAVSPEGFLGDFCLYLSQMQAFLGLSEEAPVKSLTILPGHDKSGVPEGFSELTIFPSQVISIVGPTGSGKSRLLADIEWAAQNDTPTGRRILINGETPDLKWRFSPHNRLVAQLSQNMNFVMDLSVREFLLMHAESRRVSDPEAVCGRILAAGNSLAGEVFREDTAVTALSGGQSRALMIADTAILSASPIVLIDEIENAGIDREKALSLLLSEEKIVLMATHDPMLALMAQRRIVIRNGGIAEVLETDGTERALLSALIRTDRRLKEIRDRLRQGERLQEGVLAEL